MKTTIILIFALLVSSSTIALNNEAQSDRRDSGQQHRFIFNVRKEFKGGHVEVLSADGNTVMVQRLIRRKLVVDFCDVKEGVYKIIVKKDNQIKEFEFVKNNTTDK